MPTESKPGRPFAGSLIANYLEKQIEALKGTKSQREIAGEIGYESPNLISMFKRGEARVPLDKIPLLAKALYVHPSHLFRLALQQYSGPNKGDVVAAIFGNLATENEERSCSRSGEAQPGTRSSIECADRGRGRSDDRGSCEGTRELSGTGDRNLFGWISHCRLRFRSEASVGPPIAGATINQDGLLLDPDGKKCDG